VFRQFRGLKNERFWCFFWFFWSEDKLAADLLLGKLQNPEFFRCLDRPYRGKSGSKPGITFNANVLGESFVTTVGLKNGGKEVSLNVVGVVTKIICLSPSWQTLFISYPSITSGTRDMSGKWLGAWLEEGFVASCTLTKLPSCCNQ